MKLKSCFYTKSYDVPANVALLTLRVVVGLALMLHGWGKIQNPMGWMGPDSSIPGIFQFLAALSEFGGGLAWILGLLFPLASLGIIFTMLGATSLHMFILGDPFVSQGGGAYELPLVYLCIGMLFLAMGPGDYSLDKKLFKK